MNSVVSIPRRAAVADVIPDGGDLGVAVGDARHAVAVDRGDRQPADPLGDQDALGEPDMRKLQARRQVTHRRYGRNAGPAVPVHLHEPAVHGDPGGLVAQALRHRGAPRRQQQ